MMPCQKIMPCIKFSLLWKKNFQFTFKTEVSGVERRRQFVPVCGEQHFYSHIVSKLVNKLSNIQDASFYVQVQFIRKRRPHSKKDERNLTNFFWLHSIVFPGVLQSFIDYVGLSDGHLVKWTTYIDLEVSNMYVRYRINCVYECNTEFLNCA